VVAAQPLLEVDRQATLADDPVIAGRHWSVVVLAHTVASGRERNRWNAINELRARALTPSSSGSMITFVML